MNGDPIIKDIRLTGDYDLDWVLCSYVKQVPPEVARKFQQIFFHTWAENVLGETIRNAAYAGILFALQHPEAVVIQWDGRSHNNPFRPELPMRKEIFHDHR